VLIPLWVRASSSAAVGEIILCSALVLGGMAGCW